MKTTKKNFEKKSSSHKTLPKNVSILVDRKEMKKENLKIENSERSCSQETILKLESNEVHSKSISKRNLKKSFL